MSKIQIKIMCAVGLLVLIVVSVTGILAESGLRARTTSNIQTSLARQAQLVAQLVTEIPFDRGQSKRLQVILREAAVSVGARITLIDSEGRVISDSEVSMEDIPQLTNHADRPEVREAKLRGRGHSIRRSDTVKRDLLYVAVGLNRSGRPPSQGVIRLAVDLDDVDAAAAELRRELLIAGLIGLLGALALSYGLSLLSLRPIRELREVVASLAEGRLERRLRWESQDEQGEIARSINLLARHMRDTADEALREKVQLEAVLSSMVEGVLAIDQEGKILLANPRAQDFFEFWGEFKGRSIPEVIQSTSVDQAMLAASQSTKFVVREMTLRGATHRVLLMHATPFPSTEPRAGTVAVFHDVTALRRVDEVRRDFVANASHELRTPLTAIQGFAETLMHSEVGEEDRSRYLDVILRNAQRMSALIEDLLALSRIESDSSSLESEEVDLNQLMRTILSDFAPRLKKAEIQVRFEAVGDVLCRGDRRAIEQIVSNLLSNAIRYSNSHSTIEVLVETRDDAAHVSIEDAGIGIRAEDLERIFERFYRVDEARSRAVGSTGLGLSIVKHLVRTMGGQIRVESELGQGARFSFSLPRSRAS